MLSRPASLQCCLLTLRPQGLCNWLWLWMVNGERCERWLQWPWLCICVRVCVWVPNKAARQQQQQQQRKLSSGGQVCCKLCAISKFENYAPYQNLTSARVQHIYTPTSHSNIPPLNNKSNKEQCNHLPWQVSSAATSSFQQLLLRIFILLCYESVCCGMPPSSSRFANK